jgi:hypothetical protein
MKNKKKREFLTVLAQYEIKADVMFLFSSFLLYTLMINGIERNIFIQNM